MWLTWLLVALALAMVVGPVMMLQPSDRTNRLAKLRTLASQKGMSVRIPPADRFHPHRRGAIYILPISQSLRDRKWENWTLEIKAIDHEIHFCHRWDWQGEGRPPHNALQCLRAFVEDPPPGFSMLQYSRGGFGILWDEVLRGSTEQQAVEHILGMLNALMAQLEGSV